MDKNIVFKRYSYLFDERLMKIGEFWSGLNQTEQFKVIGMGRLLDGDPTILENLYEQGYNDEKMTYNLYQHYQNHPQKRSKFKKALDRSGFWERYIPRKKTFKVAFFFSAHEWTGGVKMILLLGELLQRKGYQVDYYIPYNTSGEHLVYEIGPSSVKVTTYYSDDEIASFADEYDFAISPHFDHIFPLTKHFDTVLNYSQGDYNTFSNIPSNISTMKLKYYLPAYHIGVSNFLGKVMQQNYTRKVHVIPCGIDLNKFYPDKEPDKGDYLLVIGDGRNIYKNVPQTIEQLIPVSKQFNLPIYSISPADYDYENDNVKKIINPSQKELLSYIQKANILINGSLIESFGLPALEAMACGTPVVTNNNGGINQFGIHNVNCMIHAPNDYDALRGYVSELLQNSEKREQLIVEGLRTAEEYELNEVNERNFALIEKEILDKDYIRLY